MDFKTRYEVERARTEQMRSEAMAQSAAAQAMEIQRAAPHHAPPEAEAGASGHAGLPHMHNPTPDVTRAISDAYRWITD